MIIYGFVKSFVSSCQHRFFFITWLHAIIFLNSEVFEAVHNVNNMLLVAYLIHVFQPENVSPIKYAMTWLCFARFYDDVSNFGTYCFNCFVCECACFDVGAHNCEVIRTPPLPTWLNNLAAGLVTECICGARLFLTPLDLGIKACQAPNRSCCLRCFFEI